MEATGKPDTEMSCTEFFSLVDIIQRIQHKNGFYFVHEFRDDWRFGVGLTEGYRFDRCATVKLCKGSDWSVNIPLVTVSNLSSPVSRCPDKMEVQAKGESIIVHGGWVGKKLATMMKTLRQTLTKHGRTDAISGHWVCAVEPCHQQWISDQQYWDDISCKPLKAELIQEARDEKLQEVRKHGVYEKVPIKECWDVTGKGPIAVRWVDVNKGDDEHEDYRSRLVAK